MAIDRYSYPFTAIVGQEQMKLALVLNAINPSIGGVLIRGEKGTGKSTAVRALAKLLPEQKVVEGCHFGCHPEDPEDWCMDCRERSRSGDLPVKTPAFGDAQAVKDHRLLPVALAQLNAGAQARPRTPDWSKVESIIGTELNIALAAGSGGGAAMDTAAKKVKDYLTQQGYY